jgi:hypothetical protein
MNQNLSPCHCMPIYTDPEDGLRYCSACDARMPQCDDIEPLRQYRDDYDDTIRDQET